MHIARDIQWRKEERLHGDVELIGTLNVNARSVIKQEVAGNERIEQYARLSVVDIVHRMLYGEVQEKLFELERMLLLARPGDFMGGDGPLEKVREIQDLISEYR